MYKRNEIGCAVKVLVIGSGGREHALVWKLRQSSKVDKIFVAPGNAGTDKIASNISIDAMDIPQLAEFVQSNNIDLTIVGPEGPLTEGISDYFNELHLPIVGPTKSAARIESSKAFSKNLMERYKIPTAKGKVFTSYVAARSYITNHCILLVVKADGLASGKGVAVCQNRDEAFTALDNCMVQRVFGASGDCVLIEECLAGQEVSVFAFTDGKHLSPLVAACDYKRAFDNDLGPNTGGMGSFSPPAFWTANLSKEIRDAIMDPIIQAMRMEGYEFKGVIYAGLMLTVDGPKVIEFNCRLGDPETQVLLPRMRSDLVDVLLAIVDGKVEDCRVEWYDRHCVGVVLASKGYPGKYETGFVISGTEDLGLETVLFISGARWNIDSSRGESSLLTDGGRVMTVTSLGDSFQEASSQAYRGVEQISFKGAYYRRDIGFNRA